MIAESTRQTLATLRAGRDYPGLLRFLIGRVFYTDAINTVIAYMSLYTVNVAMAGGLSRSTGERRAQMIMMSAISAAILGGLAWGKAVDRIGPKRTLNLVLGLWIGCLTLAASIGALGLPLAVMYVTASLVGIALGGIWAADRPFMLRLTPPDRVGEFYGLYGMVGRFSAVSGPVIWAMTTYLAVERGGLTPLAGQSIAITVLVLMVIASVVILRSVNDERRAWATAIRS
jgi:UMF1 family MFS transporter